MQTNQELFYQSILQKELDIHIKVEQTSSISGGCINNAIKLETNKGTFFLKFNNSMPVAFFEAEKKGLNLLREKSSFTIPNVLALGSYEGCQYIILEFIDSQRTSVNYWEEMGQKLAKMHQVNASHFGGVDDNYIGKLPQSNKSTARWIDFFIDERLLPQVEMGIRAQVIPESYRNSTEALRKLLEDFFPEEQPALLHGDLWSGNTMYDQNGAPCIIDPAVYYGHREAELAFTTLFGGFDQSFFETYNEVFPWEKGINDRLEVYNLYPLLVHTNLFGKGYLEQVNDIFRKIDKALGY